MNDAVGLPQGTANVTTHRLSKLAQMVLIGLVVFGPFGLLRACAGRG